MKHRSVVRPRHTLTRNSTSLSRDVFFRSAICSSREIFQREKPGAVRKPLLAALKHLTNSFQLFEYIGMSVLDEYESLKNFNQVSCGMDRVLVEGLRNLLIRYGNFYAIRNTLDNLQRIRACRTEEPTKIYLAHVIYGHTQQLHSLTGRNFTFIGPRGPIF